MANTFTAPFAQAPNVWSDVATNAVSLTGVGSIASNTPTNTVLLGTAHIDNGGIVSNISAMPRASVTATALYLWSSVDGGATKNLIASQLMPAYALIATTEIPRTAFKHADGTTISEDYPLRLRKNESLYCGIGVTVASGIVFSVRESDF